MFSRLRVRASRARAKAEGGEIDPTDGLQGINNFCTAELWPLFSPGPGLLRVVGSKGEAEVKDPKIKVEADDDQPTTPARTLSSDTLKVCGAHRIDRG